MQAKKAILLAGTVLSFGLLYHCGDKSTPAPEGPLTWEKTFGGTRYEQARGVVSTADGGYIITGETASFGAGSEDVYLLKTDARGNLVWERTFGGAARDWGATVAATEDGGYVVVGGTASFGEGSYDVYLFKVDASGNAVWAKTFGGAEADAGHSVVVAPDGGYVIAGYTGTIGAGKSDVYMLKTDPTGIKLWEQTFGGGEDDLGHCVASTADGGYIIVGSTRSTGAGNADVYLIYTDDSGDSVWAKAIGGAGHDEGNSVILGADGGYVITGWSSSTGAGAWDVYLISTDNSGFVEWEKTFGGPGEDHGHAVIRAVDGGYLVAGETASFGAGDYNAYIVKTNTSGTVEWERIFGGTGSELFSSVVLTEDGGMIVAGFTWSSGAGEADCYVLKLDENGEL